MGAEGISSKFSGHACILFLLLSLSMAHWSALLCAVVLLCLGVSGFQDSIGHVCVQHMGPSELQWTVMKGNTSVGSVQWNRGFGQARCQNLTQSKALNDGDELVVEFKALNKARWNSIVVSIPTVYGSSSPLWATIACYGSLEWQSCNVIDDGLLGAGLPVPPVLNDTCSMSVIDRVACGQSNITQHACMSMGCCWQQLEQNPANAPWCFHKGPSGGGPAPPNKPLPFGPADCFVTHPAFGVSELILQKDITYGAAVNPYFLGLDKTEILKLDILSPPQRDLRQLRPAMVFIHGGSFAGGDKSGDQDFRHMVATHGYVVFSINYRMITGGLVPAVWDLLRIKPAQIAAEDARAAVRYVKKHAVELRVDPNRIIVAGESAGAISANFYGFTKGYTDGASGNAGYDSSINAVLSVSGSMRDLAFCASVGSAPKYQPRLCAVSSPPGRDLTQELNKGDIPVIDLHGTSDIIIPYVAGREMINRANEVGVQSLLLTIPQAGHVPWGNILDANETYLIQSLRFISGSLNLAEAECPLREITTIV